MKNTQQFFRIEHYASSGEIRQTAVGQKATTPFYYIPAFEPKNLFHGLQFIVFVYIFLNLFMTQRYTVDFIKYG